MGNSLQYEDFQQLLEQQKGIYLQQNSQLAKYNSSLMMKITDMEAKISELVQENVSLRSRLSMGELRYREKVHALVQSLEEGVMNSVSKMGQLFSNVREKEGLESGIHGSSLKSILKRSNSVSPRSSKTVGFIAETQNENQRAETDALIEDTVAEETRHSIELNDDEVRPLAKKRRKSSRRESLFIPADFEFNDENLELELNKIVAKEHADKEENRQVLAGSAVNSEADKFPDESNMRPTGDTHQGTAYDDIKEKETVQAQSPLETDLGEEDSYNFTTSVIEYSIPEEGIHDASQILLDSSKSKIEVYNDRQESQHDPDESLNFVQCSVPSQSKIKHSMKHPRTKLKGGHDDIMPHREYGKEEDKPGRRTRGKAVNYKLPSLRAKMRRPTEKLVDATTVTDIHDLQVERKRELMNGLINEEGVISPPAAAIDDKETQPPTAEVTQNTEPIPESDQRNTSLPLHEVKYLPNVKSRTVLKEKSTNLSNKTARSAVAKKHVKMATQETLSQNVSAPSSDCVLSELSSDPLTVNEESHHTEKSHSSSLTGFEIIDGISLKNVTKTHRVKARDDMSRRRKRIHKDELAI